MPTLNMKLVRRELQKKSLSRDCRGGCVCREIVFRRRLSERLAVVCLLALRIVFFLSSFSR